MSLEEKEEIEFLQVLFNFAASSAVCKASARLDRSLFVFDDVVAHCRLCSRFGIAVKFGLIGWSEGAGLEQGVQQVRCSGTCVSGQPIVLRLLLYDSTWSGGR